MHKPGHTQTTIQPITSAGPGGSHTGLFGRTRIFMGPNEDPKGGGAGGAGGAGDPGGEPALSEAATAQVAKMVNDAVTGAVTNHLGRFKKSFTEEITKTLGDTMGPISEQLRALAEAPSKGGRGKTGGDNGEPSSEVKEMLTRYEGRIKELEAANKSERDAREAEKATRLREEERSSLGAALRAAGLPDISVKAAVALLHSEEKKVSRTEDGRIVFKMEKGTGSARYTDELDMEAGVAEWLKTDDGKGFVPARQASGSGGQPIRVPGQNPRNPNEAKAQATSDLAKILLGG